jgi:hypothetical protein
MKQKTTPHTTHFTAQTVFQPVRSKPLLLMDPAGKDMTLVDGFGGSTVGNGPEYQSPSEAN